MLAPIKNAQEILDAELAARLKVSEEQIRQLREEVQRLKGLWPENERLTERVVLLEEEEVRWLKAQYFGSSSQKGALAVSPDQKMLFNEAEVLGLRHSRPSRDWSSGQWISFVRRPGAHAGESSRIRDIWMHSTGIRAWVTVGVVSHDATCWQAPCPWVSLGYRSAGPRSPAFAICAVQSELRMALILSMLLVIFVFGPCFYLSS
jgi:hypothetical protein